MWKTHFLPRHWKNYLHCHYWVIRQLHATRVVSPSEGHLLQWWWQKVTRPCSINIQIRHSRDKSCVMCCKHCLQHLGTRKLIKTCTCSDGVHMALHRRHSCAQHEHLMLGCAYLQTVLERAHLKACRPPTAVLLTLCATALHPVLDKRCLTMHVVSHEDYTYRKLQHSSR